MKTILKSSIFALCATQLCSAVSFDFTTSEGFAAGANALNGQVGWVADAGILANTDPTKEFLFANGGQNATYGGGTFDPTASALTFTTDFKFNATLSSNTNVFNVIKLGTGDNNADVARIYFRYVGDDTSGDYRMRYSTGNGFDQNMQSSKNFALSEAGQASGLTGSGSDDLRLTWTLTRGATADAWTSAVSLINITNSDTAIDLSYSAATVWETTVTVDDAFHNDTSIEWGLNTSGINNANIYSTSAIPEPANYALISCLSLLAFLGFRRVRS